MSAEDTQKYHYSVIRRAIGLLDANTGQPYSLAQLAQDLQMSPSHVQRVFTKWAGVSPKNYQQFLTLGFAKTLLAEHHTTLETAYITGLSGTGRLHDLFIKWEAMTPGEYASKGKGLTLRWGCFDSAFGSALIIGTERGICAIGFLAEQGFDTVFGDYKTRWPLAEFVEDRAFLEPWATRAFETKQGTVPLLLSGAPLQLKVWEALLQIPEGHVTTYSDVAQAVGNPKAVRAVGSAIGRNPVALLIPCHRALRKGGGLGGYHWGLPIKRAALAWEAAQSAPA